MTAGAPGGRIGTLVVPYLWLLLFFLTPLAIVLLISLSRASDASPPYEPAIAIAESGTIALRATLDSYRLLIGDDLYGAALLNSLRIALAATFIALSIGYPMAYAIARAPERWRVLLVLLVILPFWTSFLIRVYAWMALLRPTGLVNGALIALGAVSEPLSLINNEFSLHLGIVYSYLPFMVLPIYATLTRLDWTLLEAAADLGCRPVRAFFTVTLPLSMPGVVAGCLLVFIPASGEFVIPDLLGGPGTPMIGRVLWNEFFANRDWPAASALAVATLILLVAPIVWWQRVESAGAPPRRQDRR
ncbi:MAG TPA: ABC transporter permease subunit [Alphaproteobacteria bacterium]|nr:ABC transporter permease subunit [Alphaproteobacteria bacterium]